MLGRRCPRARKKNVLHDPENTTRFEGFACRVGGQAILHFWLHKMRGETLFSNGSVLSCLPARSSLMSKDMYLHDSRILLMNDS